VVALADLYGPLLTPRQREAIGLYYGEDMSLAEVAGRAGVTRQAVHDLLRRAVGVLEGVEGRLGLLRRDEARAVLAGHLLAAVRALRAGQGSLDELEDLARALEEDE
jgi:predicted DNA-binding protein YlxM (UPF0122 family)